MHELSICTALASIVEQHADGRRVTTVHLRVGHLRQVVPPTLVASWEIVVDGTPLAGSVLDIEHVPAVIECHVCATRTTLTAPVFRCKCGSTDTTLLAGDELLVTSLDLVAADEPHPT